jgi:hypothetical protein
LRQMGPSLPQITEKLRLNRFFLLLAIVVSVREGSMYVNHIRIQRDTQSRWLKENTIMLNRLCTQMCISSELCTQHRNELDFSALEQTEHKLQQLGLGKSSLYCMQLTERSTIFGCGVTTFCLPRLTC